MDRSALEKYLFRVAQSGYRDRKSSRPFPFPSIATFGVGFVSVLLRADRVVLTTAPRSGNRTSEARKVILSHGGREAYVELVGNLPGGTRIELHLNELFTTSEIREYIIGNIRFPSAHVAFIDVDKIDARSLNEDELTLATRILGLEAEPTRLVPLNSMKLGDIGSMYFELLKLWRSRNKKAEPDVPLGFTDIPATSPSPVSQGISHMELTVDFAPIRANNGPFPKLKRNNVGVLFVPVFFVDHELGIEWRSIHALLARNGWATTDFAIKVQSGRRAIRLRHDWIEAEEFGLQDHLLRKIFYRNLDDREQKKEDIEIFLLELESRFDAERSRIFQDGISIPVKPWWIAPLGTCRGTANLTAGARMRLNVTRISIDETPAVLREWVKRVAVPIQEQVVAAVTAALKDSHIAWEPRTLWPREEDNAPRLFRYAAMEMRALLKRTAKEPR
jgi:hypothetical protein